LRSAPPGHNPATLPRPWRARDERGAGWVGGKEPAGRAGRLGSFFAGDRYKLPVSERPRSGSRRRTRAGCSPRTSPAGCVATPTRAARRRRGCRSGWGPSLGGVFETRR
jgi:hypothetical protein